MKKPSNDDYELHQHSDFETEQLHEYGDEIRKSRAAVELERVRKLRTAAAWKPKATQKQIENINAAKAELGQIVVDEHLAMLHHEITDGIVEGEEHIKATKWRREAAGPFIYMLNRLAVASDPKWPLAPVLLERIGLECIERGCCKLSLNQIVADYGCTRSAAENAMKQIAAIEGMDAFLTHTPARERAAAVWTVRLVPAMSVATNANIDAFIAAAGLFNEDRAKPRKLSAAQKKSLSRRNGKGKSVRQYRTDDKGESKGPVRQYRTDENETVRQYRTDGKSDLSDSIGQQASNCPIASDRFGTIAFNSGTKENSGKGSSGKATAPAPEAETQKELHGKNETENPSPDQALSKSETPGQAHVETSEVKSKTGSGGNSSKSLSPTVLRQPADGSGALVPVGNGKVVSPAPGGMLFDDEPEAGFTQQGTLTVPFPKGPPLKIQASIIKTAANDAGFPIERAREYALSIATGWANREKPYRPPDILGTLTVDLRRARRNLEKQAAKEKAEDQAAAKALPGPSGGPRRYADDNKAFWTFGRQEKTKVTALGANEVMDQADSLRNGDPVTDVKAWEAFLMERKDDIEGLLKKPFLDHLPLPIYAEFLEFCINRVFGDTKVPEGAAKRLHAAEPNVPEGTCGWVLREAVKKPSLIGLRLEDRGLDFGEVIEARLTELMPAVAEVQRKAYREWLRKVTNHDARTTLQPDDCPIDIAAKILGIGRMDDERAYYEFREKCVEGLDPETVMHGEVLDAIEAVSGPNFKWPKGERPWASIWHGCDLAKMFKDAGLSTVSPPATKANLDKLEQAKRHLPCKIDDSLDHKE